MRYPRFFIAVLGWRLLLMRIGGWLDLSSSEVIYYLHRSIGQNDTEILKINSASPPLLVYLTPMPSSFAQLTWVSICDVSMFTVDLKVGNQADAPSMEDGRTIT